MIELFKHILHLDFDWLFANYGTFVYTVLFLVIFIETGLVAMPFLPGDSLLFTAGLFARTGHLNLSYLLILLFIAAVLGDNCNYWIGRKIGLKVFTLKFRGKPLVKKEYLDKTHEFYEKHGTKAIIMARFVPFVRTFAPFAAGVGEMNYRRFLSFDILGGALWIGSLTTAGYLLGEVEFIRKHIDLVCLGIILLSVLPIIFSALKARMGNKAA
ncbi:MAG: VTT domain-containing protein [Bacteroidia bacterium]|jgi:membrane-associated protein|nr:VTT domain-containing protein [Bacteroidia bacterium]